MAASELSCFEEKCCDALAAKCRDTLEAKRQVSIDCTEFRMLLKDLNGVVRELDTKDVEGRGRRVKNGKYLPSDVVGYVAARIT